MLFPYSTDLHDGKIGIVTLSIIILCFIVHMIVWTHDNSVRQELYAAILDSQVINSHDKRTQIEQELLAEMDDKTPEQYLQEQREELEKRVDEIKSKMWLHSMAFIPSKFNPFSILTSMFTHADWMHLIGNMLFFYVCGVALEKYWGTTRFVIFYLLSGIGATLFYLLYGSVIIGGEAWSNISLVGASGAISGTIGALLVKHPKNKVHIFYWFYRRTGTFSLPVYGYFGLWTLEQLVSVFTDTNMKGGVAFTAHIGGLLTGVGLGFLLKSNEVIYDKNIQNANKGPKKFVVIGADNAIKSEKIIPDVVPLTPQLSLIEKGWQSLGNGNPAEASQMITSGIDQLFVNPSHNRLEIEQNVKKFIAGAPKMTVNSAQVYDWGKKLQTIDLPILAIYCYDCAMRNAQSNHIGLNSILSASQLRLKHQFQIDHAIQSLNYVQSKYPDSVQAQDATKILSFFAR
jgi:membrane associated rhomboid family serine protease